MYTCIKCNHMSYTTICVIWAEYLTKSHSTSPPCLSACLYTPQRKPPQCLHQVGSLHEVSSKICMDGLAAGVLLLLDVALGEPQNSTYQGRRIMENNSVWVDIPRLPRVDRKRHHSNPIVTIKVLSPWNHHFTQAWIHKHSGWLIFIVCCLFDDKPVETILFC